MSPCGLQNSKRYRTLRIGSRGLMSSIALGICRMRFARYCLHRGRETVQEDDIQSVEDEVSGWTVSLIITIWIGIWTAGASRARSKCFVGLL